MPKIKKQWEVRYFVTAVASVPLYKCHGKTETYKQAAKDGWGTVYRDENNVLVCDEDCSASLYTKNGGYFGIFPCEEIDTRAGHLHRRQRRADCGPRRPPGRGIAGTARCICSALENVREGVRL